MKTAAVALMVCAITFSFSSCTDTSLKSTVLQQLGLKPTPLASGGGGGAFEETNGVVPVTYYADLWGGSSFSTFDAGGALTGVDSGFWTISNGVAKDFGADGVVAWGWWSAGSPSASFPQGTSPVKLMQYGVSRDFPLGATANALVRSYSAYRSSPPTIENAGVITTVGSPDSVTGSFSINYPGNTLDYSLSISVGSHSFSLSRAGGPFNFQNPYPAGNAAFYSKGKLTSSSDDVTINTGIIVAGNNVQGMPAGLSGERLILGFGFNVPSLGNVTGTVILK